MCHLVLETLTPVLGINLSFGSTWAQTAKGELVDLFFSAPRICLYCVVFSLSL